jgi:hypothetical protein
MNTKEQAAFVKAYGTNVAHHSAEFVADFVARYEAKEDFDYSCEHISIMDALGMWHEAIEFHINQSKEASHE